MSRRVAGVLSLCLLVLAGCETATQRRLIQASLDTITGTQLEHAEWWNLDLSAQPRAERLRSRVRRLKQAYDDARGDGREIVLPTRGALVLTDDVGEASKVRTISGSDADRTRWRNQIAVIVLMHIAEYHDSNYDDLYEGTSFAETVFDFAGLALGGAGSFATGSTSQVLSGIAGGLVGAEAALKENYLNDLGKFQMMLRMEAMRREAYTAIMLNLLLPDSEYSLYSFAADAQELMYEGSIRRAATQSAREAVDRQVQAVQRQQRALSNMAHLISVAPHDADRSASDKSDGLTKEKNDDDSGHGMPWLPSQNASRSTSGEAEPSRETEAPRDPGLRRGIMGR